MPLEKTKVRCDLCDTEITDLLFHKDAHAYVMDNAKPIPPWAQPFWHREHSTVCKRCEAILCFANIGMCDCGCGG